MKGIDFIKKTLRVIKKSEKSKYCQPLFFKMEIQTVINLYIYDLFCAMQSKLEIINIILIFTAIIMLGRKTTQ